MSDEAPPSAELVKLAGQILVRHRMAQKKPHSPLYLASRKRNAKNPHVEFYTFNYAGPCRDGRHRIYVNLPDGRRIEITAKRLAQLRAEGRLKEKEV